MKVLNNRPRFNELAVELVMDQFLEDENWWGVMHSIAKIGFDKEGKTYPYVVFLNDDIKKVLPDNGSHGVSFFESRGSVVSNPEEGVDFDEHNLSVIFWVDITRLMADKSDIFYDADSVGEFLEDAVYRIKAAGGFDISTNEDPTSIMSKYSLFDSKRQSIGGRQFIFKIDFSIRSGGCHEKIKTKS